jgi:Fe2+ or Zn2+ uptake regulation protein
MVSNDLQQMAVALLNEAGQRFTAARRAVVDVLAASDRPLMITEIIERAPSGVRLAQSSVYRNLAVLEGAGVVRRVAAIDEFGRYELAEEMMGHHHHLLCSSCGSVEDVTLPGSVERAVDRALSDVAAAAGFRGTQHRLDLVGICAKCH